LYESDLANFEAEVLRHESRANEKISQNFLGSILIRNHPNDDVKRHLNLNIARLDTYEAIRSEIITIRDASSDNAMVLGALYQPDGKKGRKGWTGGDGKGKKGGTRERRRAEQLRQQRQEVFLLTKQAMLRFNVVVSRNNNSSSAKTPRRCMHSANKPQQHPMLYSWCYHPAQAA
jgi:hypothetical protein